MFLKQFPLYSGDLVTLMHSRGLALCFQQADIWLSQVEEPFWAEHLKLHKSKIPLEPETTQAKLSRRVGIDVFGLYFEGILLDTQIFLQSNVQ